MREDQLITAEQFLEATEMGLLVRSKVKITRRLPTNIELFASRSVGGNPHLFACQYFGYSEEDGISSTMSCNYLGFERQRCLDAIERFLQEWQGKREYPFLWLKRKSVVLCKVDKSNTAKELLHLGVLLRDHCVKIATYLEDDFRPYVKEGAEIVRKRLYGFLEQQNRLWERTVGPII